MYCFIIVASITMAWIISCSKTDEPKEYLKSTYTNYQGYWDYCHFGSNDINTELNLFKTEKVLLFDHEVVKDTTYCKSFNCPRIGQMQYLTRITLE